MEEKEREHARAKAARADYAKDAEEAQAWLQAAEARTQDRAGPRPHDARARLQEVSLEAGAAAERLTSCSLALASCGLGPERSCVLASAACSQACASSASLA